MQSARDPYARAGAIWEDAPHALNPALPTATLDPLYSYFLNTQLLARKTVDARALDVLSRSRKLVLVEGFDQW